LDLIIERLNGDRYITNENNMKVIKFNKGFPEIKHDMETIENRDGFLDMGTVYETRKMDAEVVFTARDRLDNPLVQNKIFRIFDSREPFYLIDDREPGKRWLVKCESSFTPDQRMATFGTFDIAFVGQPYGESIGTTLDPKTFDADVWQIGQGLIDADEMSYSHNTTSFQIYNAGDVMIDPREHDLVITFTGASSNLRIENTTNGTAWQYNDGTTAGSTVETDVIKLTGVRSLKNNISIFGETNRQLIELEEGINDIVISGTSGDFVISFDFRFKYL
jgi:hypothetical protein